MWALQRYVKKVKTSHRLGKMFANRLSMLCSEWIKTVVTSKIGHLAWKWGVVSYFSREALWMVARACNHNQCHQGVQLKPPWDATDPLECFQARPDVAEAENSEPWLFADGTVGRYSHAGKVWQFLSQLYTNVLCELAVLTLGINSTRDTHPEEHTRLWTALPFSRVQNWELGGPLASE